MEDLISHRGIVDDIANDFVRVRIVQHSACSECKVKSLCSSSESKEKIVDVHISDTSRYSIGEEVMVFAYVSVGCWATVLAFVMPLIILVGWILLSLKILDQTEVSAILIGLLLISSYYLALHIFRGHFERHFEFKISKPEDIPKNLLDEFETYR